MHNRHKGRDYHDSASMLLGSQVPLSYFETLALLNSNRRLDELDPDANFAAVPENYSHLGIGKWSWNPKMASLRKTFSATFIV